MFSFVIEVCVLCFCGLCDLCVWCVLGDFVGVCIVFGVCFMCVFISFVCDV